MSTPTRIDRHTKPKALKGHDKLVRTLLRYGDKHGLFFYFRTVSEKERFENKNPIKKFTYLLGGDIAVAKALGLRREAVWLWADRERIPPNKWGALMELANQKGVEFPLKQLKAMELKRVQKQIDTRMKKLKEGADDCLKEVC